jgi:hypothetical protein
MEKGDLVWAEADDCIVAEWRKAIAFSVLASSKATFMVIEESATIERQRNLMLSS